MPATEMGAVFLGTDIILVHIPDIGCEIAHIVCLMLVDVAFIGTVSEIIHPVKGFGNKQPYAEAWEESDLV